MAREFPDIHRGTQWHDVPARVWQQFLEVTRAITEIRGGPGILIQRRGRLVSIRLAPKPAVVIEPTTTGVEGRRLILASAPDSHPEYLVCRGPQSDPLDYERVLVGKPWEFRQSSYDATTRNEVTYEYETPTLRLATVQRDEPLITISAREIIVPAYLPDVFEGEGPARTLKEEGDEIIAERGIVDVSTVTIVVDNQDVTLEWYARIGNRAWTRAYDTDIASV